MIDLRLEKTKTKTRECESDHKRLMLGDRMALAVADACSGDVSVLRRPKWGGGKCQNVRGRLISNMVRI